MVSDVTFAGSGRLALVLAARAIVRLSSARVPTSTVEPAALVLSHPTTLVGPGALPSRSTPLATLLSSPFSDHPRKARPCLFC